MKNFIVLFCLSFLFFSQRANSQLLAFEKDLKNADSLWKTNHLPQAIDQYKLIISNDTIPEAWQSLAYLRLAKAQFEAKQLKDCRATLIKAKSLPVLPDHNRLIIEELEQKLKGLKPANRTIISAYSKPVVSIYVSALSKRIEKND